ncbi:E3 ubiquitin-protein ligase PPP1R11-like [Tubulanus polymorphus]|uniref:E3 ubiquitin-protein ligase PPP1R11-like n=1 Tax=Tubulanus polymorphus TaxID=672921 RepID=UPI003DA417DF
MAEGGHLTPTAVAVSETIVKTDSSSDQDLRSPSVVLKLRKPKNDRKVSWTDDTIDNEMLGKKKSKCCCIYEKPKLFGESSGEEDDDDDCTGHCRGHKKKCFRPQPDSNQRGADDMDNSEQPGET